MAHTFNLWNFYPLSSRVCSFDITPADISKINQGSGDFIAACLEAFQVRVPPASWTITPFRSYYFSDYTSSGESWGDRWSKGWNILVSVKSDLELSASVVLDRLPIFLDALDPTARPDDDSAPHNQTALVVSVYYKLWEETIEEMVLQELQPLPVPEVSVQRYPTNEHQVRLLFRNVSFPDWLPTGEGLLEAFRKRGGSVNKREQSENRGQGDW
jgi:hypothetical protein